LLPSICTDFPRKASLIVLLMEAVQTSETLVNLYQSTRRYNPEGSHLRAEGHENLKSQEIAFILAVTLVSSLLVFKNDKEIRKKIVALKCY
jgi:hypothetical protein